MTSEEDSIKLFSYRLIQQVSEDITKMITMIQKHELPITRRWVIGFLVKIWHLMADTQSSDKWVDKSYIVVGQPSKDMPVYIVQREDDTSVKHY